MDALDLLSEDVLLCPVCGESEFALEGSSLNCKACDTCFSVKENKIIFTENYFDVQNWESKTKDFDLLQRVKETKSETGRVLSTVVDLINGPKISELRKYLGVKGLALNLGGGADKIDGFYNVDLGAYDSVNIVAGLENIPFKNNSIDLVASNSVLEHIYDYRNVISEVFRILKADGYFYLCVPNYCMRHHQKDYHRWMMPGLEKMLRDENFMIIESGFCRGPVNALSIQVETIIVLQTKPGFWRECLRSVWLFVCKFLYRMEFSNSAESVAASQTIYALVKKVQS